MSTALLLRPPSSDYVTVGRVDDSARRRRAEIARAAMESRGQEAALYSELVRKLREPSGDAALGDAFAAFHDDIVEWAEATSEASFESWPAE